MEKTAIDLQNERKREDKWVAIIFAVLTAVFSVAGIITAIMKFGSVFGGK
jgi:hypothetical protein